MQSQQNNEIIRIDNVVVEYDHKVILPGVDLSIKKGDFIAITGPNGGGKTSLLRAILGLIEPRSGKVKFYEDGREVKRLNIGYLPQKSALDTRCPITVRAVVSSGLLRTKALLSKSLTAAESVQVDDVLKLVGMDSYSDSSIGNLSGGQLQRTLFARAIVSRPSVLVLDEPLSYIDKTFEAQFYEIVEQLAQHTTIILVSHEMARIMQMANRHIIVDRGIEDCHAHRHFIPTDCK